MNLHNVIGIEVFGDGWRPNRAYLKLVKWIPTVLAVSDLLLQRHVSEGSYHSGCLDFVDAELIRTLRL